jgi:mono/diheme cytochrome c family protein
LTLKFKFTHYRRAPSLDSFLCSYQNEILRVGGFGILFKRVFGRVESMEELHARVEIPGGCERVYRSDNGFSRYPKLAAGVLFLAAWGILGAPALRSAAIQDAGQTTPPAAAPAAPKPVDLPDGDGKPIATEYCQDCHRLTNLTKAHKNLDDWNDTLHTMIDRGSRLPDDKIDTLAKYLAANFGPKTDASPASGTSPSPAAPAATTSSPDASAPAAPAPAKVVVDLPEGDGKAIATENCQACHKLTNLTKAHKSLDDWKDTVQLMMDRGANVPADKVDILVQYLAKNFGPKDSSAPAAAAPPSSN